MRSVADNPDHSELTALLRQQDGWGDAVEQLQALVESRRDHVGPQEAYRDVYAGERAAMVFDVVASRLRMRSGADALKPDVRVRRRLRGLGFRTPTDDAALLLMAEVAAAEVGLSRFELDQLLW
jgi:hypothetical protein